MTLDIVAGPRRGAGFRVTVLKLLRCVGIHGIGKGPLLLLQGTSNPMQC